MGLTERTVTETFGPTTAKAGDEVEFYLMDTISSDGKTERAGVIKGKIDSNLQLKAKDGTNPFKLPCYDDGATTAHYKVAVIRKNSPSFISHTRKTFYLLSGATTTLSALLASGQAANPVTVGQLIEAHEEKTDATAHEIEGVNGLRYELDSKASTTDPRLSNARTPTGGAGGVLSGSYPNPGFAVNMATQDELDAHVAATQDALNTKITFGEEVADAAARLALTDLPTYYVVKQADNGHIYITATAGQTWFDISGPMIYRALISQTNADHPVAIVLQNDFVTDVVWTRNGTGSYVGEASGMFLQTSTGLNIGRLAQSHPSKLFLADLTRNNDDSVLIQTYQVAGSTARTSADSLLNFTYVEILVFPPI